MKNKKAMDVLTALVQGLDPTTGVELGPDSVLQRAEVLRALLTGIEALKQQFAREARRAALPGRIREPWTPQEEHRLIELFQAGSDLANIATEFDRTVRAIEARLERLGLLTRDQRTTRDSFA